MCDVLKEKLTTKIAKWNEEIKASPDARTIIDLPVEFEDLFCRNIVQICFGEDVSDSLVEVEFPNEDSKEPAYVLKKVPLNKAIHEVNRTMIAGIPAKNLNPLY